MRHGRVTAAGHLSDAFFALAKARDAATRNGDDDLAESIGLLLSDTNDELKALRKAGNGGRYS